LKKIKVEANDFEKFRTRLERGEFGGSTFDRRALSKAIFGDNPGFFGEQFKKLQKRRAQAESDEKLIGELLSEKKSE